MNNKIVHISHIDLDGYGAMVVTKEVFGDNIDKYNVNYGEIENVLNEIEFNYRDYLILTDLNLNEIEAKKIVNLIDDYDIKVFWVDHHRTREEVFDILKGYKNNIEYVINHDYCATYLTFENIEKIANFFKLEIDVDENIINALSNFVEYVNVYDMWKKDHYLFKKASFVSDLAFKQYPILNKKDETDLKIYITYIASSFLNRMSVEEFERHLNYFIRGWIVRYYNIKNDVDLSIEMLMKKAQLKSFDNFIIKINDEIELSIIQPEIFQVVSSDYLDIPKNENKVLINVDKNKGNMSIRSKNRKALEIAKKFGGGGHPNASGARLPDTIFNEMKYNDDVLVEYVREIVA